MRSLCAELETGAKKDEKAKYEQLFNDIKQWYIKQHDQYETLLKGDMLSQMGKRFEEQLLDWDSLAIRDYTDNAASKCELFNRTEQLCKLVLTVYSYGPNTSSEVVFKEAKGSWLDSNLGFFLLIEILQGQLYLHNEGWNINLAVFTEEKNIRNALVHRGEVSVCASAIRCYNILRDMLIFMEPECGSRLPRFAYPKAASCNIQQLMNRLKNFNFSMENTLLITGSLRDLPEEALSVLANLPWNAVVDLDGYSAFGGLRRAVHHSNINNQKFQKSTASNFTVKRNMTTWFTCGDFANYLYSQPSSNSAQKKRVMFPAKEAFCDDPHALGVNMQECVKILIENFAKSQRPLNILYIHYYDNISKLTDSIINNCESVFAGRLSVQYTVTAVYYDHSDNWDRSVASLKRVYGSQEIPLRNLTCDLDSMSAGLIEFKRDLPVLVEKSAPFMLPSENGLMGIGEVMAFNLDGIFDVLYSDSPDVTPEQAAQECEDFFCGGAAAWSVFRDEQAVTLLREDSYQKRLSNIRDVLAHIPDPDSGASKIFTIFHAPGIGGSTLLRKIGWDFHMEYPVLLIKRYDNQIKNLVHDLYDKLKKGVLMLVDDTVGDIERLKEDVRNLDRACALIISTRNKTESYSVEKRGLISFVSISPSGETALRNRFKQHSQLSKQELQEKDRGYDEFVKPTGMRCPFMIGLYYREKQFNGVDGYVQRMMEQVKDIQEVKILAMLALCDYYSGIGLPQIFVDRYMQIPTGASYLKKYPHVEAVLLPVADELGGSIDTYHIKHYLISEKLLEKCCDLLYGSTLKNSVTDLSKLFIDAVFAAYQAYPADVYQDILEFLFINKEGEDKFSQLILEAVSPSSRKDILLYLSEKFNSLAELSSPEEADCLYRMTAHFYGHLGRLCHNREYGLDNPSDAMEYCEKAVALMEASFSDNPDPLIYHMLGVSRSALFRKELDEANRRVMASSEEIISREEYTRFEDEIDKIREIFEKAAYYGSEEYAVSSLIDLYTQYLIKVYRWKNIRAANELSERQMGYQVEIENLLEWAGTREMSERSRDIFRKLNDTYHANLQCDENGMIQYYENRLSKLKGHTGVDAEILDIRRGLITARLAKHYSEVRENPGRYIVLKSGELFSVLGQLEEVLGSRFDPRNYSQRTARISFYSRWFYLAKMPGAGRSLEKAIAYSERWIELCEQSRIGDPKPYYYFAVCSLLYMRAGNAIDQIRVMECWKKSQSLGSTYKDRLRDVIVKGEGMEQLLDMGNTGRSPNEYIEESGRLPLVLAGVFERIEADRGYISLQSPVEWNKKEVKFTCRRGNALGENQLTHKLATFAGFSYEGFRAIDQYIADLDANEPSPQIKRRETASAEGQIPQKKAQAYSEDQIYEFIPDPRNTAVRRNGESGYLGWLNGKINGVPSGISIEKDIYRFGKKSIKRGGGIRRVINTLSRKEKLPCVILKREDNGSYIASLFRTGKSLDELLSGACKH